MAQREYSPEIRTVLDYVLEDDDSPHGGIDHFGETVREYLASVEGDGIRYNTLAELNKALSASGIKPIESVRPSLRVRLNEARQERGQERVRRVMNALDRNVKRNELPETCFSTLPGMGELVILRRGVTGYYPSDWETGDRATQRRLRHQRGPGWRDADRFHVRFSGPRR